GQGFIAFSGILMPPLSINLVPNCHMTLSKWLDVMDDKMQLVGVTTSLPYWAQPIVKRQI
ncbi:hypothetical protein, partial [Peribacillus sp. NPDC056705]|uniref:hypothetical protein n=1 Tax=Peribacillus sp. NPDC056705 TaxID=3345918 RepID=UPI003749B8C1